MASGIRQDSAYYKTREFTIDDSQFTIWGIRAPVGAGHGVSSGGTPDETCNHPRAAARQTSQIVNRQSLPSHSAPVAERQPAWLRGVGWENRKFGEFGCITPGGRCAMIGGNKRGGYACRPRIHPAQGPPARGQPQLGIDDLQFTIDDLGSMARRRARTIASFIWRSAR